MKRKIIIVGLTLVLVIAAAWFAVTRSVSAAATTLSYSGTIEAEQIAIAPEIGGRVTEVRVKEGDAVNAGDILVQIDPALIDTQIQQAQAALATAGESQHGQVDGVCARSATGTRVAQPARAGEDGRGPTARVRWSRRVHFAAGRIHAEEHADRAGPRDDGLRREDRARQCRPHVDDRNDWRGDDWRLGFDFVV
jgi:multidrug resistance efflux pump